MDPFYLNTQPLNPAGSGISRVPKNRKLLEFWICGRLRFFAGVLRVFAAFLRGVLGVAKLFFNPELILSVYYTSTISAYYLTLNASSNQLAKI